MGDITQHSMGDITQHSMGDITQHSMGDTQINKLYLQGSEAIELGEMRVPAQVLKVAIDSIRHLFHGTHQEDFHAAASVCHISLSVKLFRSASLSLQQ